MAVPQRIAPCLWFDDQAEEAARFYIGVFPSSRMTRTSRYGRAGHAVHGQPAGKVLAVAFELDGQAFTALNGGPAFTFNEAISLQVSCETQAEVDHYWEKLSTGGDEAAQQCGWLKDRYGISWQIVPTVVDKLLADAGSEQSERATAALLRRRSSTSPGWSERTPGSDPHPGGHHGRGGHRCAACESSRGYSS